MANTKKDDKKQSYKKPTTNYRMDSHKDFCKRCYEYNHGCPHPRGMKNCSL